MCGLIIDKFNTNTDMQPDRWMENGVRCDKCWYIPNNTNAEFLFNTEFRTPDYSEANWNILGPMPSGLWRLPSIISAMGKVGKLKFSADGLIPVIPPIINLTMEEAAKRAAHIFEKSLRSNYLNKVWAKPLESYVPKLNVFYFDPFETMFKDLLK